MGRKPNVEDFTWINTAALLKASGVSWAQLPDALYEATGYRHSYDKIRQALRRREMIENKQTCRDELDDSILDDLRRNQQDVVTLSAKYDRSVATIIKSIANLRKDFDIVENGDKFELLKEAVAENKLHKLDIKSDTFKFAAISDTHLCSKYQQLTLLNDFYDRVVQFGAKKVYHAGDILDGENVYKGHKYEIFMIGADSQAQYAIDYYPKRDGVETDFVGGNHDLVYYKTMGLDICKSISAERKDLNYLGQIGAYIEIFPGISLYILHPDGGGAYAVSYKPQRIAAGFHGGGKPRIMMLGHWHEGLTMFERNIHIVLPMSFQSQTPYLMRKGIMPKIGGYLCEAKLEDNSIREFTTTAVTYYRPIEKDY